MSTIRETVSTSSPASGASRFWGILISFITASVVFFVGQALMSHFRGSTTRPFGGIGLGLTLARRLCELLGGSLAVESTPARGTRVALRFPTACRLQPMEGLRASM